MSRRKIKGGCIRARAYDVLRRAVEEGTAAGIMHAHKHVEHPTREHLADRIQCDVMNAICEVFDFEEPEPR